MVAKRNTLQAVFRTICTWSVVGALCLFVIGVLLALILGVLLVLNVWFGSQWNLSFWDQGIAWVTSGMNAMFLIAAVALVLGLALDRWQYRRPHPDRYW